MGNGGKKKVIVKISCLLLKATKLNKSGRETEQKIRQMRIL